MRQILSISIPEIEAEYILYLSCFYNMTISEYIRSVLREKWYDIDKTEIKKPISFKEFESKSVEYAIASIK